MNQFNEGDQFGLMICSVVAGASAAGVGGLALNLLKAPPCICPGLTEPYGWEKRRNTRRTRVNWLEHYVISSCDDILQNNKARHLSRAFPKQFYSFLFC